MSYGEAENVLSATQINEQQTDDSTFQAGWSHLCGGFR